MSRATEFPGRTEETAVHRGNLSHVASGHRRCVIHERGINRKLKIVITRRFRSLTVISTDTYRPAYFRHAKTRDEDNGREVPYISVIIIGTLYKRTLLLKRGKFFIIYFSLLLIVISIKSTLTIINYVHASY